MKEIEEIEETQSTGDIDTQETKDKIEESQSNGDINIEKNKDIQDDQSNRESSQSNDELIKVEEK